MWHTVSLDELLSNEEKHQRLHVQPIRSMVEILDRTIEMLLTRLGVDCSQPRALIGWQQQLLGINTVELTPEGLDRMCRDRGYRYNPSALGIYIYQDEVPIFFIPDLVPKDGKVTIRYLDFHDNREVDIDTIRIPK